MSETTAASPPAGELRVTHAAGEADRAWLRDLWRERWTDVTMVSRGKVHHVDALEGVIAWDGDLRVGAATYRREGRECEMVSLDAIEPRRGIGTALTAAVEAAAREHGCRRLWLITTNDNTDALRFYQRRGYRLRAVHPGAVDEARRLKPSIGRIGDHGIPIHDELELEKFLDGGGRG